MALYIRDMFYRFHSGTKRMRHVVPVPLWHCTSVSCCIGSIMAQNIRDMLHRFHYGTRSHTRYDHSRQHHVTHYWDSRRWHQSGHPLPWPQTWLEPHISIFTIESMSNLLGRFQSEGLYTLPWFQTEGVHTLPWFQSEVDLHVAMVSTGVGLHVAKRERFARYHGYQTWVSYTLARFAARKIQTNKLKQTATRYYIHEQSSRYLLMLLLIAFTDSAILRSSADFTSTGVSR